MRGAKQASEAAILSLRPRHYPPTHLPDGFARNIENDARDPRALARESGILQRRIYGRLRPRRATTVTALVGLLTSELSRPGLLVGSFQLRPEVTSLMIGQWRSIQAPYSVRLQRRGRSGIQPDSLFVEPFSRIAQPPTHKR